MRGEGRGEDPENRQRCIDMAVTIVHILCMVGSPYTVFSFFYTSHRLE